MTNSRSGSVVLVVAVALLAASAQPVGAASAGLVVASQHTDFGTGNEDSPQTLDNAVVSGSGDSAVVTLPEPAFTDGFEDEPADGGVPDAWEENSSFESSSGSIDISTAQASAGSQSVHIDASSSSGFGIRPAEQPLANISTAPIEVSIYSTASKNELFALEGSTRNIRLGMVNGDLQYYDGSYHTISTAPDQNEWVDIRVFNISTSANTYQVEWSEPDGNSGTSDPIPMENPMDSGYDTTRLETFDGEGYYDEFSTADSATTPATYVSAPHDVTNSEEAQVNITTLTNATATITISEQGGVELNQTTVTTSGTHTLAWSPSSADKIAVNVTVTNQTSNGAPSFVLSDESILFDAEAPTGQLDSPPDGAELTESSVDFSIQVNDSDFPTAQGDSVDVLLQTQSPDNPTWQDAGSQTLTSNGTATVTETLVTGGQWEYRFKLTDSYGETTTTAARSVSVPAELEVRSALPPHNLIDDVNLTVRFYEQDGSERVFQENPTDGTISLAGLPTSDFVVTVRANESYAYRRIVLDSLYQQSTAYLLPNNASSSQIVFQLDDQTGRFDAATTTLYVEAPITRDFNGDGNTTTKYITIAGDNFGGSEQFPVTLQNDQRYRLRVVNAQGETRVLGSYTTSGDALAVLPIGQVVIDSEVGEGGVAFDAAVREDDDGSRYIRVVYRDPEMATDSLTINVTRLNDGTVIRPNSTQVGPYGRYIETIPVSGNQSDSYEIVWSAERNSSTVNGTVRVGDVASPLSDIGINPAIKGLIGYGAIVGLTGLVIIRSPRAAGIVGVGTATVVTALGVVSIAPSALGIGGAIAVLAFVGGDGR